MSPRRFRLRWLLLPLLSLAIFLGSGELALRAIYRDAGTRTLGGPGGLGFDHLSNRGDERGRFDVGPRRAGVPRLLVIGDSITYGQGVHDWRDAWPELVAKKYEQAGQAIEMAVLAMPGRDMPQHLEQLTHWGPIVQPDTLIYQWYVNDIEVIGNRPVETRSWQQWFGHRTLRRHSYFYYFLDNRLSAYLASGAYTSYIVNGFMPGTAEWSEFERYFHTFAVNAQAVATRRILLLYPQVPYRGTYHLQSIHDRLHHMAGAHDLVIPPTAWVRFAGSLVPDAAAPWKQAVSVPTQYAGNVVDTRDYVFAPGHLTVRLAFSCEQCNGGTAAVLEQVDAVSNEVLMATDITGHGKGTIETMTASFDVPGSVMRSVRFRVRSTGRTAFRLFDLRVPVDYGMTVVDLVTALNGFNTHASIFDAHPNEAAHRVIADEVFTALQNGR